MLWKGRIALPLATFTLLLFSALADGADWTRFRGPNGTGVAADKDIPVRWDLEKDLVWKVPMPGPGNSSPVIWGDRLFVQSPNKDGSQRQLLCLSVKDGSTLWSRGIPARVSTKGGKKLVHPKNTLCSSSPAVDAERVYVVLWDNNNLYLQVYTHAGEPVWAKDLGTYTSEHGPGASPIVFEGKVYFNNDQDGKAVLLCFDAKTGDEVWHADRAAFRACYSSPFFRDLPGGKKELILVSTTAVTGYDPDKGTKHWSWQWKFAGKGLRTTASPLYADGVLLCFSGDGGGDRYSVALQLGETPKMLWENRKELPYVPTPVLAGNYLYLANDKGFAGCYDIKSGKKMWFERLADEFTASLVLIDGKVYAIDEQGDVFVFEANPAKLNVLAKNSLNEIVRATPAVADNRLFIRGHKNLYCIGKAKG
jgi:outer membrane protein assembly factor BamB